MNTLTSADPLTSTALYLYIDCETLPSQNPAVRAAIAAEHVVPEKVEVIPPRLSEITAAANLKNPELIEEDIRKKRAKAIAEYDAAVDKADADHEAAVAKAAAAADKAWRDTSKSGTTGHIACISWAFGGIVQNQANLALWHDDLQPHDVILRGERAMLVRFFENLDEDLKQIAADRAESRLAQLEDQATGRRQTPTIVAHFADFDIRFIWQRAVILGVPVPAWWPINARPWETDRVQDTMTMWAGHNGRISLDRLCTALGIPGKGDGLDGSKVWDAVADGKIGEVCKYCDDDVRRLRSVHRRLRGLPVLDQDVAVKSDDEAWLEPAPAMDDEEAA